jgi:hypothetical protein
VEPVRPEVPLVSNPFSFACVAERLARARTCPDRTVVVPTRTSERVTPDSNPCKEVALSKFKKFFWSDITDAPSIDNTICDVS